MDKSFNEIKRLANLKYCYEKDRAKLILVYLGLKPAFDATIYGKNATDKTIKILEGLGMYSVKMKLNKKFYLDAEKEVGYRLEIPTGEIVVARDKKIALRLSKTLPHKHHRRYGKLMGYPKSAIDNFVKKEPQLEIKKFERLCFKQGIIFNFRVPAKNYQESLKVLKTWSLAIKKHVPDLYAQLRKDELMFYKTITK